MRIITVIIIIFILFMNFRMVNGRYHNRNFIRNLNKSIVKSCNKKALLMTNNNDIYNCIMSNEKNCYELPNYIEYADILKTCMKVNQEQFGAGILLSAAMWVGIGIFSMIMSGV